MSIFGNDDLISKIMDGLQKPTWKSEPVPTNDQPISRIVERLFSECLPPSFKPFVDRVQAEKILAPLFEAEFAERTSLIGRSNQLVLELSRVRGLLQRQWISVEERLPELNQNVLVCNVGGGVWSSIYGKFGVNEEETGFYEQVWCPGRCEEYREVQERNITHWQPSPEPSQATSKSEPSAETGGEKDWRERAIVALYSAKAAIGENFTGEPDGHTMLDAIDGTLQRLQKVALAESSLSSPPPPCTDRHLEVGDDGYCANCGKYDSQPPVSSESPAPQRCTLCGGPRIPKGEQGAGTCTFIPCKDPLHDNRIERLAAQPSGDSPLKKLLERLHYIDNNGQFLDLETWNLIRAVEGKEPIGERPSGDSTQAPSEEL